MIRLSECKSVRNIAGMLAAGLLLISVEVYSKTIYMSSSGNDLNSGDSEETPVLTFTRAKELCKSSSDDTFRILLKGGDTFTQFVPETVSLYGDDQTTFAFVWDIDKPLTISTYGSAEKARLYGAGYYTHSGGPGQAILIIEPSTQDVLIENLFFEMWELGTIMVFESEDVHIRNIKIDKVGPYYFPEEQTPGVYCAGVIYPKNSTRILIENVVMTNCHNNYEQVGDLHGFYCTRLSYSEIRNCFLQNISGSPFKFRRREANNDYVHDNQCYYTGVSTQTPGQVQFGFLRYSGDPGGNCPYALVFENNIFHYPYVWIDREDPQTARAVHCTVSNETSCGSDACLDSSKVKWINNDFKYQWEMSEYWTGPEIVPLLAPSNLTAVALSDKQVQLSWNDNSTDEDGFIIERTFGPTSFIKIGQVDSNVTSFTDRFLLQGGTFYTYRVKSFRGKMTSEWSNEATVTTPLTGVRPVGERPAVPQEFALEQNFPNPFNPATAIGYQLPESCHVRLRVLDLQGRVVDVLVDEYQSPGYYRVSWQPDNLPSGLFFYQLQADDFNQTNRLLYLK